MRQPRCKPASEAALITFVAIQVASFPKAIYIELHPETAHETPGISRQVGDTGERSEAERFTANTATATGQSERKVQRDAERGEVTKNGQPSSSMQEGLPTASHIGLTHKEVREAPQLRDAEAADTGIASFTALRSPQQPSLPYLKRRKSAGENRLRKVDVLRATFSPFWEKISLKNTRRLPKQPFIRENRRKCVGAS